MSSLMSGDACCPSSPGARLGSSLLPWEVPSQIGRHFLWWTPPVSPSTGSLTKVATDT